MWKNKGLRAVRTLLKRSRAGTLPDEAGGLCPMRLSAGVGRPPGHWVGQGAGLSAAVACGTRSVHLASW